MTRRARPPGLPPADNVYRDAAVGARAAIARLTNKHRYELDRIAPTTGGVYAARFGRIAAGGVLLAFAISIVAVLVVRAAFGVVADDGVMTALLIASWPSAIVARSIGRAIGRRRFAVVCGRVLAMSDLAYPDVVNMRGHDVRASVRRRVERLEGPSIGMLLAGIALLAPLSLHLLLMAPAGVSLAGFDSWIMLSAVLVGHCHIVLAIMAWRFGRVVSRAREPEAARRAGWQAYRLTVATSFFPGVFLVGIPVFLVLFTGVFIPAMFGVIRRIAVHERDRLHCDTI